MGYPLFDAFVRGEPLHPGAQNFHHKITRVLVVAHREDFVILACTV